MRATAPLNVAMQSPHLSPILLPHGSLLLPLLRRDPQEYKAFCSSSVTQPRPNPNPVIFLLQEPQVRSLPIYNPAKAPPNPKDSGLPATDASHLFFSSNVSEHQVKLEMH